jgi:hypothetical protein
LLERVHFGLYCANVVEIAVLIIAIGGRWWALTAPILVAFGPRYGTIGEIVVARAVFTVLLGIGAIAAVVTGR